MYAPDRIIADFVVMLQRDMLHRQLGGGEEEFGN